MLIQAPFLCLEFFGSHISKLIDGEFCGVSETKLVLVVSSLIVFVLLAGSYRLESKKDSLIKFSLLVMIAIPFSIVGFKVWHDWKKDTQSINLASFTNNSSHLHNLIIRGLRKGLADGKTPFKQLIKPISEANSKIQLKNCFGECGGQAIVWGSSSSFQNGNIIFNLSFKEKCFKNWTKERYDSFRVEINNPVHEDEIERKFIEIGKDLSIFSNIKIDSLTCQFIAPQGNFFKLAEERIKQIDHSGAKDEWNRVLRIILAHAYYNANDVTSARSTLKDALSIYPNDLDLIGFLSLTSFESNDYAQTLRDLDYPRAILAKSPFLLSNRGIMYRLLGRFGEAVDDFNDAIELENSMTLKARYLVNRAQALDGLGKFKEALLDYKTAVSLDPKDDRVYLVRPVTYLKTGDYLSAAEDLTYYSQKYPEEIKETLPLLCISLWKNEMKDSALKACDAVPVSRNLTMKNVIYDLPGPVHFKLNNDNTIQFTNKKSFPVKLENQLKK